MANITAPIMLDSTGQDIADAISTIGATSVGNLNALTTTDKTSLVGAVNEVKSGLTNVTTWYDEGIFNDEKTISSAFEQLKFYETNSSGGTVFSELTVLGEWVPQVIALNKVIISRSGNTYTITNNPDSRYIRILSNRVG